ncbi:MAG: FixH family protein [Pseudomonadota bacterium]
MTRPPTQAAQPAQTGLSAPRPLTGRSVAIIAASAFAVILSVNLTMAWFATSGFPGLVVKNSYIASQRWDRTRAAQEALGWEVRAEFADGVLDARFADRDGAPLAGLIVTAEIARPTADVGVRTVTLAPQGAVYRIALADLAEGRWVARLTAIGPDGAVWTGHARFWAG